MRPTYVSSQQKQFHVQNFTNFPNIFAPDHVASLSKMSSVTVNDEEEDSIPFQVTAWEQQVGNWVLLVVGVMELIVVDSSVLSGGPWSVAVADSSVIAAESKGPSGLTCMSNLGVGVDVGVDQEAKEEGCHMHMSSQLLLLVAHIAVKVDLAVTGIESESWQSEPVWLPLGSDKGCFVKDYVASLA